MSVMVSVIVPAFNAGMHLRRCLDSILNQSCAALEVIAVDDHSTDSTAEILREYAARDPRVKAISLTVNVGVHAARAIAFDQASAPYVGFVDSDDWIGASMYETMIAVALRERAEIVTCGASVVSESGDFISAKVNFSKFETITDRVFARFCRLEFGSGVLWNKIYARELIREFLMIPLPRSVDASEDYIVNVGCFVLAREVVLLPERLYNYVDRSSSASRSSSSAAAFVRLVHAYVTCLRSYAERGEEVLSGVDELYARQLQMPCYQVVNLSELDPYQQQLRMGLEELAAVRPQSFYALMRNFYTLGQQNGAAGWGALRRLRRRAGRAWARTSALVASNDAEQHHGPAIG